MIYTSIILSIDQTTKDKNSLKMKLSKDPHNQLYAFDLAQTYQELKKYNKAIKLYTKSHSIEGEKGWYSEYMIGKCYEAKGDWDNALAYYQSAFKRRPSRAEPLYDIAQHYHLENNHSKVCFFANLGRKIPYPKNDNLFIDKDIYRYKLSEMLSISAYYDENYRQQGKEYIDDLLFDPKVPEQVKKNSMNNILFYVENIKNVHYLSMHVKTPFLSDWSIKRYLPLNPSIIKTDKGYTVNCRSINCVQWYPDYLVLDGSKKTKTKNMFIEYDKNLNKYFESEVIENESIMYYQTPNQGLEDLRMVEFNNETYFSATSCQLTNLGIPKMCLGKFNSDHKKEVGNVMVDKVTLLQGPNENRAEKNWLPFVVDGELLLIYSFAPFIIYKPDLTTGKCTEFINKDPGFDFSRFAGSAPPIAFADGYLLMIHEGIWRDRKYYVHRFVYLDKNFEITKVSEPFTFKHQGVEMCCGMVINHTEDQLIMTIALEDREAYFALIDLPTVCSLLKPLPKAYEA